MNFKFFTIAFLINVIFLNAQTLPLPDHVIIVMLENKGYTQIIGSSNAPYINSLISDPHCALFSDSHGITHPSQPNYLELFSGNNQGVVNDNQSLNTPYSTCNLAYSLISHGYTFKGFSESLPSAGSLVFSSGNYVQRHCPWASWIGTGTNQISANVHQPYTSFPAVSSYSTLPTVSFIIPDNSHNMHDPVLTASTGVANGDTWLSNNIPNIITWVKSHNSLLIIQYDEDESLTGGATVNKIPTMFIGSMVQGGTYNNTFTHYGLLRTIEDMYSLPICGSSITETAITNCWITTATGIQNNENSFDISLFPNPANEVLNVTINSKNNESFDLAIADVTGKIVKRESYRLAKSFNDLQVDVKDLSKGIYSISLKTQSGIENRKFIIE